MIREMYYAFLNLITFGKGIKRSFSGNAINIPVRYHKYFPVDYEKENMEIFDKHIKEGMTVIDVGAHIGLLSVILANKTGNTGAVYAFEPTPSTFEVLKKTIRINNVDAIIHVENAALSEQTGKTVFFISNHKADNSNSLVNNQRKDRNENKIDVQLYSIDDYVAQKKIRKVDFIKIDAEGAEFSVLKGAQQTLKQFHPRIILALHPDSIQNFGHSLEKIWNFIEENNYEVEYQSGKMTREKFISNTDLFDVLLFHN